jgi:hypothetical protein
MIRNWFRMWMFLWRQVLKHEFDTKPCRCRLCRAWDKGELRRIAARKENIFEKFFLKFILK